MKNEDRRNRRMIKTVDRRNRRKRERRDNEQMEDVRKVDEMPYNLGERTQVTSRRSPG